MNILGINIFLFSPSVVTQFQITTDFDVTTE